MALLMALDSQSDTVGFDEVYNRTRREHRKVNRRISGHRCMWCFIDLDVVVSVYATWYFCDSCFVVLRLVVDDVGVGFFGLSCGITVEIGQVQSSWLWIMCYCLPMNLDPVL